MKQQKLEEHARKRKSNQDSGLKFTEKVRPKELY